MHSSTEAEIIEKINGIFCETFEIAPDRLVPEARIFEDLGLDSLDAVDLLASLQTALGVRLRDSDRIRSVRTLADVYALVLEVKREMETETKK
jgi:acyl carrier protein